MNLGSGILKKPIPDPGFRGKKSTGNGSRIRIRNTVKIHLVPFFEVYIVQHSALLQLVAGRVQKHLCIRQGC
jgi:hypothetical protein